ncbi:CRISPR-associated endonuclease Cas2 2 [Koleobacter methoxysyntrophicus]|jgi:CRISPR-associated protein Cas2|uniref:CRISPR-associated endoribonuclease Cas2 n=1 Tax=Koleobacter methoxysyntrophicus TaxID=2751313 RepID=A0A8A0RLV3_9FIRM|nr:CRISPR-associated endonuclease Cas2 [Koleobacter methoxysyntrophicus]QSQ08588.1 CRISPR-associated endonuclease Cas2 2 [Koleobacter methoxysyntrophicus]
MGNNNERDNDFAKDMDNVEEIEEKRKYLVVVIYDIVDDRRRLKMAKFLKGFGFRVQRSCFECILDMSLYKKLIDQIENYISDEDLLRVYRLTGNMEVKAWGDIKMIEDDDFLIL